MPSSRKDIGIILCDCHGEMCQYLDFDRLVKALESRADVAAVHVCSSLCTGRDCRLSTRALAETGVQRLVVGACNPGRIEPLLVHALKASGLNDGLSWIVDMRDHAALAFPEMETATSRALGLLELAVSRVSVSQRIPRITEPVNRNVAVVGAGLAGLSVSSALAELGHGVILLERASLLGGSVASAPELYASYLSESTESDAGKVIRDTVERVETASCIRVYKDCDLASVQGQVGSFSVAFRSAEREQCVDAGAIVLATGASFDSPAGSFAGAGSARIVDMNSFAGIIREKCLPSQIAFVMDVVGQQGREVTAQVLSAAETSANRFGSRVTVYCQNLRVASPGLEKLYRRTRDAGVVFMKFDAHPRLIPDRTAVAVEVTDPVLGSEVRETFDLVVMADTVPRDNLELTELFEGLRSGPAGSMQPDNVWLLPGATNRPGIFTVGGAMGNTDFRETVTDSLAVADKVHALLAQPEMELLGDAAEVDAEKCVLCLTCLRICPHGAVSVDAEKESASVSAVACQRCGICAAECPAQAITLPRYADAQMAVDLGQDPEVIVFACENSAAHASEAAAGARYNSKIRLVRVPCAGKVDPRNVLRALEQGAERVVILGCHPENCRSLDGSARADRRLARIVSVLETAGISPGRVEFHGISAVEPAKFLEYVGAGDKEQGLGGKGL